MPPKQPQSKTTDDEMSPNIATILGIRIISTSLGSVLQKILEIEARSGTKQIVFTPNPEFLVTAQKDPGFKEILNQGDFNIPDGIGLVWASRFLGEPIKERISGADLVEKLMEEGNKQKWAVGIVGARRGVVDEVEELMKRLKQKYPNIHFVNLDKNSINSPKPYNLILASHGMVKQEKWILENKNKINSRISMGVGGSLDFLTGFSKRAPIWMQHFGLEWLWRGLQRPGHFRRIWRAVIVFPFLVLKEKLRI